MMHRLVEGDRKQASDRADDNISSTRKIESVIGVVDTVAMSGILGRLATRGEGSGSQATPASCLATGAGSWKCTC